MVEKNRNRLDVYVFGKFTCYSIAHFSSVVIWSHKFEKHTKGTKPQVNVIGAFEQQGVMESMSFYLTYNTNMQ